jgi:hypothetical protein
LSLAIAPDLSEILCNPMIPKSFAKAVTAVYAAAVLLPLSGAFAASSAVTLTSDTAVYLSGPGITLILASGSTLASYSVSSTSLTLSLGADSSVTVKSNDFYTLANSQSQTTQCSATYSYATFSVSSPTTVTITPSKTVACTATASPAISSFAASPASVISGQNSSLSWVIAGASYVSIDNDVGAQAGLSSGSISVSPTQTTTYTLTATNYLGTTTASTTLAVLYSIGGTVSGLSGTVVLQNNGAEPLTLSSNGSFTFATATTTGGSYSVTVQAQPSGQTCSVSSGSGAVSTTNVTNISVSCSSTSSGGGGGGGGGSAINPPTVNSFIARPSAISPGQSSVLSWSLSGASSVSITPSISTTTLSTTAGSATVTPLATTMYKLVAVNSYGYAVTATTTVVVSAPSGPDTSSSSTPADNQNPAAATPATGTGYCLVNNSGTLYLIIDGVRHGIANPGLLNSYGYSFTDAISDTAACQALPKGDLLGPADGALVKSPSSPTVYLISGSAKHGFSSAKVFRGQGFSFSSVLTIPAPQLDALPDGSIINNASARHLRGVNVISGGTIYYVGATTLYPYPSLATFNTWNLKNDFSRVVPANKADIALPMGSVVAPRSSCSVQ